MMNTRDEISLTIQSNPVCRPCPVTPEHANICQCRPEISSPRKSNNWLISSNVRAPPKSCLFANINKLAPSIEYFSVSIYMQIF